MTDRLDIILVPHTHWDREWYQTFQQFRMRLVHVVDTLLDILDRDPAFTHFMLDGQIIVLDDYLEVRPEQEEHLKRYTRSGRISVGPWYLQPDEFLVSGESLIRNLHAGLLRAKEFGKAMRVGYVPDTFGHTAQLPQILLGVGIDNTVFWRGVGAEAHKSEFYWAAPDGSRVLVLHLADPMGYSNARDMPLSPTEFVARTVLLASTLLSKANTSTLLFMNGSDHLAPQEGLPAVIAAANDHMVQLDAEQTKVLASFEPADQANQDDRPRRDGTFDSIRVRIGSLEEYVAAVSQQIRSAGDGALQTLSGEMRSGQYAHLLPSVLSTRMWIKQQNAATEHLLEHWVEPLTAWAARYGAPYPHGLVQLAWKYLLHNHPHDSICGCSIDQVHRENRVRFDQSQQIGEQLAAEAMQHLVARVDTRPPAALSVRSPQVSRTAIPLVVFNPAPGPRTEAVQADIQFVALGQQAVIVDEQGMPVPLVVLKRWQQEIASMSLPREMIAAAIALEETQNPEDFITLAENSIGSFHDSGIEPGQSFKISGIHINEEDQPPGSAGIELVLASPGQVVIHREALLESVHRVLALLQREDIENILITITDLARATLEFVAADLPAYGLKTYWLYPRGLPAISPPPENVQSTVGADLSTLSGGEVIPAPIDRPAGSSPSGEAQESTQGAGNPSSKNQPPFIENEFYRVEADPEDGTLTVTDRLTGAVYPGLNRFVDSGDVGDLYNYSPPASDLLVGSPVEAPSIEVSSTRARSRLNIHSAMSLPVACSPDRAGRDEERVLCPVTSEVTLTPGVRRIDIHTSVQNNAKDHLFRVTFPVFYPVETAFAEGVFEVRDRPATLPLPADVAEWFEEPVNRYPQKRFVDVSDGTLALAVLNRGLPEYEVIKDEHGHSAVAVTLLRCVEWLSRSDLATRRGPAGPPKFTPEAQCQGLNVFDYALVPHAGTWESEDALVLREAQAFNLPVRVIISDQHAGELPSTTSQVEVEPRSLVVSAIKRQHDGNGLVVRLYNPLRHAVEAGIRPGFTASRAFRTNLIEEPQEQLFWSGDEPLYVGVRAGEIVTLLFS